MNQIIPFPKNPIIAKFFMQLGRFDELGSGVLNINKYCKAYSGLEHPEFIEGAVSKTIIPIDVNLSEYDAVPEEMAIVDAVKDEKVDAVPEKIAIDDAVKDEKVDAVKRIRSKRINTRKRLKEKLLFVFRHDGIKYK